MISRLTRPATLISLVCALTAHTAQADDAVMTAARMSIIFSALQLYSEDAGRIPTTEEGLWALTQSPLTSRGWRPPLAPEALVDAWGEPFVYRQPGFFGMDGFDLYSKGANRLDEQGNGDDITLSGGIPEGVYSQVPAWTSLLLSVGAIALLAGALLALARTLCARRSRDA